MADLAGKVGCVFLLVVAALLQNAAAQTTYTVGDSLGWIVPPGGASAYTTWASSKTFRVGDTLEFSFTTGEHDVAKVSKTDFDACTKTNPIGSLITTGPANVTLDSEGGHYYICTIGRHCEAGQKLAVTVSTSSGTSPSASPPSASPAPPTTQNPPASPAPTSGTPSDCAPTPSSSPTADGPSAPTPPTSPTTPMTDGPTPPVSSSPVVTASSFVAFLSMAMGFLF